MKYDKVLFICRDNQTMGPMAEAIYKSICPVEGLEISSRGLVVLFEAPINPKVSVVLGSHGLAPASENSKGLDESDFTRATLVLTMNEKQRDMFHEKYPLIPAAVLSEYVGNMELTDPYGGSLMDYEKCFSELSLMLRKLTEQMEADI